MGVMSDTWKRHWVLRLATAGKRVGPGTWSLVPCLVAFVLLGLCVAAPASALGAKPLLASNVFDNPVTPALSSASGVGVFRWGSYKGGGSGHRQGSPTLVPDLSDVVALAASNSSNYALLSSGQVWAWGSGKVGELGDGTDVVSNVNPVQVAFPSGTDIKAIGESYNSGYGIDSEGNGWGWGTYAVCVPHGGDFVANEVPGLSNLVAVSGGGQHVMWLTADGNVYTCGENKSGQLGVGSFRYSGIPLKVTGLPAPAVAISAGNAFSSVLLSNGEVWDWGQGDFGQLGDGTTELSNVPVQVQLPAGTRATQIYAGGDVRADGQEVAILNNGEVVGWGSDAFGQLGDGNQVNVSTPVLVSVPKGVTFNFVATGGQSSYGIDSNGNVWAWGANSYGQIGLPGANHYVLTPAHVDGGASILSTTARDVVDYHP